MIFESPSNSFEWMIFLAQKYSSMFAKGTWLTLYIAVAGTLLGFVLGYIVGIVNDIKLNEGDTVIKKFLIRIMKVIFTVYVEVFRDTPMIVQAMIVYFGIRQMGFENLTPVFAGIVVTVLNTGAYMGETVRAGIGSIDLGQREGAWAMGMSPFKTMLYVILDPDLIATVPANTAAACGIDAMVHALEAYISKAASPFSDIFAREALRLIGGSIRDYVADRSNPAACESMMVGSLFAGIAFSHARLGNVHAMSHPVSAYFDVPHGVANAILLPTVVDFNKDAADPEKYRYIYGCISKDMGADINFTPDMLATEIRMLNYELGILPTLSDIGVTSDKFEQMADDAMKSGNIQCNPQFTMKNDILKLYEQAF